MLQPLSRLQYAFLLLSERRENQAAFPGSLLEWRMWEGTRNCQHTLPKFLLALFPSSYKSIGRQRWLKSLPN